MLRLFGVLAVLGALLMLPSTVLADFTSPINPSPNEPDLLGSGGILDTLYGLSNLTRVYDLPDSSWDLYDHVWEDGQGYFAAQVKYAAHDHELGYVAWDKDLGTVDPSATPVTVFSSTQAAVGSGWVSDNNIPATFVLWLEDKSTGNTWYSDAFMNPGYRDHMVTYHITGFSGHVEGDAWYNEHFLNYVIAWEDLDLGDQDYQDVVVELSEVNPSNYGRVPLPGSLLLCLTGLGWLGMASRFRRLRKA